MGNAIRAEFRKFFTTRLWWGMLIPVFAVGGLMALLGVTLFDGGETETGGGMPGLSNPQAVSSVYTFGLSLSRLLLLAIGVMSIGAEYRHKTITGTFLATPVRGRVMGAKVISLLAIGAMYGIVQTIAAVGVGGSMIASKGFALFPEGVVRSLLLGLLVLGLWALIGLGVGILIPNQVAALLIAIGFAWILDPILSLVFASQDWGKGLVPYFPSQLTSAIVNSVTDPGMSVTPLSWQAASVWLLVYAALLAGLGTWRTMRADIS